MMTVPTSTATSLKQVMLVFAFPGVMSPTAIANPLMHEQAGRPVLRSTIAGSESNTPDDILSSTFVKADSPYANTDYDQYQSRTTTEKENIIGEIRQWNLFGENWDGEGALAPSASSVKDITSFVMLLDDKDSLPEAMLYASGRTGLFWESQHLYAELEFYGNGRIAYYIERNGNKHKGVIKDFKTNEMPDVFPALIKA